MHGYYHIWKSFPCQWYHFICQCYFFSTNVIDKTLLFFTGCNLSQVDIIHFSQCHIPQVNCFQNIIFCLIMKRHVQKHKQSLILFHPCGTMITFWGLMKINGNAYGILKYFKESMILCLLLMYWVRRVCILKFVMLLWTNII